ncbi:MAG: hypothetical protein ACXVIY_05125 [Mucilaginibacter sp.]
MKTKFTLALILLALAFSCKKDANSSPIDGKWRTTEILFTPNMTEALYIQFIPPGKVQSTFFSNCSGYSINGNDLTLKYNSSSSINQASYTYSIKNDTLSLSPVNGPESANGSSIVLTFVKE